MKTTLLTTSSVAVKEQFSYWNEAVCNVFTELYCHTPNRRIGTQGGYKGSLEFWDLGELQLTHVTCDASRVNHGLVHVAKADEEVNLLHLQLAGSSLNIQGGREAYLQPGDFTVCNSSRPYLVHFDNAIEMLVVRIPEPVLSNYFTAEHRLYGQCFSDSENTLNTVFKEYIQTLWRNRNNAFTRSEQKIMSGCALSLFAGYMDSFERFGKSLEKHSKTRLLKMLQRFIDRNLPNHNLTPETIALAHNISTRYLRSIFANAKTTCSRYITKQRLETAAHYLAETRCSNLKIIDIAFRCGFQDASYFAKCFRQHYSLTPSEYRTHQKKALEVNLDNPKNELV